MKKIGEGLQYAVYDLGNGRVHKVLQNPADSRGIIDSWQRPSKERTALLSQDYQALSRQSHTYIRAILADHPKLGEVFGHPEFQDDEAYIQDKVQTLGEALRDATSVQAHGLIDGYITLNLQLWRYGVADRVYNFTINNGVDARGNVVWIDFGEVETDLDQAAALVLSQHWLHQWSYTTDMPKTLQYYFAEQIADRLTVDKLKATWRTERKG